MSYIIYITVKCDKNGVKRAGIEKAILVDRLVTATLLDENLHYYVSEHLYSAS